MAQTCSHSRNIIISPQAGFANRLRALNSAILAATESSRNLYHYWLPCQPNHRERHINWIKQTSLDHFFECEDILSTPPEDAKPDLVLSEWACNDYWYNVQSSAQIDFGIKTYKRAQDYLQAALNSTAETILIETSLRFWPRDHKGLERSIPTGEDALRIHNAYSQLAPKRFYLDLISKLEPIDIGVAIRRGDLLKYSNDARQEALDIYNFLAELGSGGQRMMIFSDDSELVEYLTSLPGITQEYPLFSNMLRKLLPHQKAMATFLLLAFKCRNIYGTPTSSFAQEAALFGNRSYDTVLRNGPQQQQ